MTWGTGSGYPEPRRVDPLRTHALVVGVGHYAASDIGDRPGLARTADRFADWLRLRGVPEDNIVLLGGASCGPDRAPTATNIDRALTDDIPGRAGDLLWIFWAGHGVLDARHRRRLLLADSTDRNKRSVDLNELLTLYGTTFVEHFPRQLVVVDACQTDLPGPESTQWARPISLPEARARVTHRVQRVWLAASAGERAAYSAERAWFSDTVLDSLEAGDSLYWSPTDEEIRDALKRKLDAVLPPGSPRQNPVTLAFGSEDGTFREEVLTVEPEPIGPSRQPSALRPLKGPVLDAYLRWMVATHSETMATIADRREIRHVHAPLAETPWTGTVVEDEANHHARRSEGAYLRSRRLGDRGANDHGEAARVAARPFPTSMSPLVHVDKLDLSGRPQLPADGLLGSKWRFIVLGDPGSGKTTLARRFALHNAENPAPTDPCWRLPVLCRATDLIRALADADGDHGTVRALAALAVNAGWNSTPPVDPLSRDRIAPIELSRLVAQAADQGRLLLMVDGLDEVPTGEERGGLVLTLNQAVDRDGLRTGIPSETAGNQLVVTSRVVGYYANPMSELVHQLILQPMDAAGAVATGCFWLRHFALATGKGPAQAEALESRFRSVVAGEAANAAPLAANPYLLVSLISAVASGDLDSRRLRKTPMVRSDLYRFMVEDALDRARQRLPRVPRDQLLTVQAAVAYEMHRSFHSGLLAPTQVGLCVEAALDSLGRPHDLTADQASDYVRNLGLMTDRGPEQLGFLHLTLEEYLAGRHLVEDGTAARIQIHLSDPRWVEPIRLGLGHLGRTDPSRLDSVLLDLLSGPGSEYAARLLASSIAEFRVVRAEHVEAAVTALLAADRSQTAESDRPSRTAETVAPLLSTELTLQRGQRTAEIVRRTLARALRAESMWDVSAAARTVEALGLFDREVAEALFAAQERDAAEYGWFTVRALQSMVAPPETPVEADPAEVQRLWAGLTDANRKQLAGARLVVARRPAAPVIDRLVLPRTLTPFRAALDSRLIGLVEARPVGLLRVVLCLYGVVPFLDTERWTAEKARLKAELVIDDTPAEVRHRAAVRLDTVIAKALAKKSGERLLDPAAITVDSPLTPRLLRWIEDGTSAEEMARQLRLLAEDVSADDRARGDALAAWFALGTADSLRDAQAVLEQIDEGVRQRLTWRMDRASFVLADAAARISVGSVVTAFEAATLTAAEAPADVLPPDTAEQLSATFTRALAAFGFQGLPPDADVGDIGDATSENLVAVLHGWPDDRRHTGAAVLDAAGARLADAGPLGLIRMLARAHRVEEGFVGYRVNWDLDPLAPRGGPWIPEALTALDGMAPRLTYARCWLLDRMAPVLVEQGFAVEAFCLALHVHRHDPVSVTRTVRRLAAMVVGLEDYTDDSGGRVDGAGLPLMLSALASDMPGGYPKARAMVQVARLRGRPVVVPQLLDDAGPVERPEDRLRLIELAVGLSTATWSAPLRAEALHCAEHIDDPLDRVLALARSLAFEPAGVLAALSEARPRVPEAEGAFLQSQGFPGHLLARRTAAERKDAEDSGARTDPFRQAVVKALREVGGAEPIVGGGWEWDAHLQIALVGAIYGRGVDDKVFSVAVILDTVGARIARGGPFVVAQLLATAHLLADEFGDESEDWYLDRYAPVRGSLFPEALTALSGLSPRMTFVRCWLIDRMASQLATGGFGVEAVCLTLVGTGEDPAACERTLQRLRAVNGALSSATADVWRALDLDDPLMPARLLELAEGIEDRYARARAMVHVAALRGTSLRAAAVLELAEAIVIPEDRLRFVELADSLAVCDWSPDMSAVALSCAAAIEDPTERVLACTRLLARGGTPEQLLRLRVLGDEAVEQADDLAVGEEEPETEDALQSSSSSALLAYDQDWQGPGATRSGLDAWATVSCVTLCTDVLAVLRTAGPTALWRSLADPEGRPEAVRALRRHGQDRLLALGTEAVEAIDLLLREGSDDLAADLLSVVRPRRGQIPPGSWRSVGSRRFADRATLLTMEAGRLDAAAVRTLPRLLSDHDDLVRLRGALATSFTARGSSAPPRFTATSLGPAGLADFAHLVEELIDVQPRLAADVRWALSDVIHNSLPVLRQALGRLTDRRLRRRLLHSVIRVTPETLAALPDLLAELPEDDQIDLVYSLECIARDPRRCGVGQGAVRELAQSLRSLVSEAYPLVLAEILCVLGLAGAFGSAPAEHRDCLVGLVREGIEPGTELSPAVTAGACHGLGFLLEGGGLDSPEERGLLRTVAGTAEAEIAEAAVTALARIGDMQWLSDAVAARDIDPATMLWGLAGGLDAFVVGPEERLRINRICAFVMRPPGSSGADAADITDRLIAALLDRVSELMLTPVGARSETHRATNMAWEVKGLLSIVSGLAHVHPAAVRRAVDNDYPDFRHKLVQEFAAGNWVSDQSAARLLVVLGDADRAIVGAILDTSLGTDVIRQDLLQDLKSFEPVTPEGVALLVEAVGDANLKRCYLAVRILAALVHYEVLDDANHMSALAAIRSSLDRPDMVEPLLLESFGVLLKLGTYGDAIRRTITGLIAEDGSVAAGRSERNVLVQVADEHGDPLQLAVPDMADGVTEVLEYQTGYFRDTEGREISEDLLFALRQLLTASWSAGIPLAAVLGHAAAEVPAAEAPVSG